MKYFVNGNYLLFDYLRNNIDGKSKNNIKSLLKNEAVFVNGKIVTKYNYVLCDGDVVEINKKKANNNINIIYYWEDYDGASSIEIFFSSSGTGTYYKSSRNTSHCAAGSDAIY